MWSYFSIPLKTSRSKTCWWPKNSAMFFEVEVGKLENKDFNFIKKNLFACRKNSIWKQRMCFNIPSIKFRDSIPAELTESHKGTIPVGFFWKTSKRSWKQLFISRKNPMQMPCWKKAVMDNVLAQTEMKVSGNFYLENGWPLLKSSMLKR